MLLCSHSLRKHTEPLRKISKDSVRSVAYCSVS